MSKRTLASLLAVGIALTACSGAQRTPEITLMAHDSFAGALNDDTFRSFTEETGIRVRVISAGDAGAMVNQAVLTADNPLADVIFGVDNTFLSRALNGGVFVEYESELIDEVSEDLITDPRVTPIDYGDVCLNYDLSAAIPPPENLEDLLLPEYRATLVVENPATSSPGLAFLLATIAYFGEDGWGDFWKGLVANQVEVVADWDTAYYSSFSRYGGDRPLVVSYASSPPAEVIFSDPHLDIAPTRRIDSGCYRQIEFAGIASGTDHHEEAGMLIDFLLSTEFQETIPLNWFMYPANKNAQLPPVFVEHSDRPTVGLRLDEDQIEENRERWIEEWTQIVLP